jgi:serine/threonine protein kinase
MPETFAKIVHIGFPEQAMTPTRWREIEDLYHLAADLKPAARAALLEGADAELRREVESLLAHLGPLPDLGLLQPECDNTAGEQLKPGDRLGPYRIEGPLGAGGMAEVYRARDKQLDRDAAIKILPAALALDPERLARFEREAKVLASLNHPNIAQVYGIAEGGGSGSRRLRGIAMELVPGNPVSGPLPVATALDYARQIAGALIAAHECGIVHRDLKPANIMVTPDGIVKVLDFGLAKTDGESQATSDSRPVLSASGMILGTAGYMAPEQARAQNVDRRADIWAFGVVLYEMLTGSRLFEGATVSDCIADILRKEPDLSKVPPGVRRLLGLCLQKDLQKRLQSLGDWQHLVDPEESQAKSSGARGPRKIAWFAVPAILVTAAAGIWLSWPRPSHSPHPARFQLDLPEGIYFDRNVSVSPDGQNLVFSATGEKDGLWIHNLDTLEWRRLPGTEHGKSPFWSPDSRYLGFVVPGNDGSEVKKIDVSGGSAATVYTAPGHRLGEGSWNQNGDLIVGGAVGEPIRKISANGGAATAVTVVDAERGESSHGKPQFLPDGEHFLYWVSGRGEAGGMYSGSLDNLPAAQPRERIITAPARYANGKLLFVRGGALMAQLFDANRHQLTGQPMVLAEHAQTVLGLPVLSASDGVLAYRSGPESAGYELTWLDRHGKEIGTVGQPGDAAPKLSPDQRHAAVIDSGPGSLWILDFARGLGTRFTFQSKVASPVWSRDGKRIFYSSGPKLDAVFVKNVDESGPETELLRLPGSFVYPTSVSPDGRFLLYFTSAKPQGPGLQGQTWVLPLAKGSRSVHLLDSPFSENWAVFSPDGRWIAYRSNESGRFEVYLRSVVSSESGGLSMGEGKWQVSRESVSAVPPAWRQDSKEVVYMTSQDVMTAVSVDSSHGALQLGSPTPLFTVPCSCGLDMTADGQRFLVQGTVGAGSKAPLTIVLNWQTELKRR